MAVNVTKVDHTLLLWLARNASPRFDRTPLEALRKAALYFSAASTRLGAYVAEGGVAHVLGLYHHDHLIKSLKVSGGGTLHARIESADEGVSWQDGALTLERRRHPLPDALLGGLEGRRLRDVIDAPWLAPDAVIVQTEENPVSTALICDRWIVPMDRAESILNKGTPSP